MDKFKRIFIVLNLKSLSVAGLSVASTYMCAKCGLLAEFPLTLITTAVVFPIVFSIGGAYKRRETALGKYGSLKAHGRAIYLAARDWPENSDEQTRDEIKSLLGRLLKACRTLFTGTIQEMPENETAVYRVFSELSLFIKGLRSKGLASGEASRCNQYVSKAILAFEDVKHIYQYRTPRALRVYSDVFIVLLPILYGPYFAFKGTEFSHRLEYVLAVLFSVILVSLDKIQDHLENPFDQIGEDDVVINVEKFVSRLDL